MHEVPRNRVWKSRLQSPACGCQDTSMSQACVRHMDASGLCTSTGACRSPTAPSPGAALAARPWAARAPAYSDEKVANRDLTGFRVGDRSHGAVSRRPPISLTRIVARTESYTLDAKVCDLSIVQGAIFCRPRFTLIVLIRNFVYRCSAGMVAVADTLKEEAAAESQAVSIAVVATAERLRAEQNAAEATVAEVAERLRLQREALEATADRLRMEQERLRVEVAVAEQLRAEHEAAQAMVEWLRCEREAADMKVEQLRAEQGAVEAEEVAYYTQRLEEVRAQLSTRCPVPTCSCRSTRLGRRGHAVCAVPGLAQGPHHRPLWPPVRGEGGSGGLEGGAAAARGESGSRDERRRQQRGGVDGRR